MPTVSFSKPFQFKIPQNEPTALLYWTFVCVSILSIFLFDLHTPLGIAAGTPYVLIVFSSLWHKGNFSTYIAVSLGIFLTIAGLFLSQGPDLAPVNVIITNRLLALSTLLITGFMVLKLKQADHQITSLKTDSYIDFLTQCKTDRAFIMELNTEIKRCKRYNHNLSLAIFDVDHFTKLIDAEKLSKQRSDQLIKILSKEIRSSIRNSDLLYRLGHDRFAVIFVETDIQEAKEVCNTLREKIFKSNHITLQPGLSVSIGIATLDHDDNRRKLYKRANNALIKAKENGRNRVSTLPVIKRNDKTPIPAILIRSRMN